MPNLLIDHLHRWFEKYSLFPGQQFLLLPLMMGSLILSPQAGIHDSQPFQSSDVAVLGLLPACFKFSIVISFFRNKMFHYSHFTSFWDQDNFQCAPSTICVTQQTDHISNPLVVASGSPAFASHLMSASFAFVV